MKKLFIAILAVLLLTSAAFAQTTFQEVKWEDVAPAVEAAGLEGEFYAIQDTGLAMWIPVQLEASELTEEDVEAGMLCFLSTEDVEEYVAVTVLDGEGATPDQWVDFFNTDENTTDVEDMFINGIEGISYTDTEIDTLNVGVPTGAGYLINFAFFPASDENFSEIAAIMAASIQPYQE